MTLFLLPGLRQVFDDTRSLQDRFRKNGTKDSDLIQYAREKGYREDARLFNYAPYGASQEVAHFYTFENRFDIYGNQSLLIARDPNGTRTYRRFNADGRSVEEKDELSLLWEERPELYRQFSTSSDLRIWAANTGSKDPTLGRKLSHYSPYTIGDASTIDPLTIFSDYTYDYAGVLRESRDSLWNLQGSEQRRNLTQYDSDGNETHIESEQGIFNFTLYKDREGRLIKRTGNGDEFFAVDSGAPQSSAASQAVPVASQEFRSQIIYNFLLTHGRLPTAEEFDREAKRVTDYGEYASRARLTLVSQQSLAQSSRTPIGQLDASLVKNYGMSAQEISEALRRNTAIQFDTDAARRSEDDLETKHLETLVQKTFRRLLGRDPAEDSTPGTTEFSQAVQKLRDLNSRSSYEKYLRDDYNKDSSGRSEHQRRSDEVRTIIDGVDQALRIYFGFLSGTLDSKYLQLLKILKSDPAFEMRDLTSSDLDKIRARLLELLDEDIHFGQSAVYAVHELLIRRGINDVSNGTLTMEALFADILTGVISPEFIGNLQFSAYTLKALAQVHGVNVQGLKLTWDQLVTLVHVGYPVIANIELRHFVLVTGINTSGTGNNVEGTVTFLENGILRTRPLSEFKARWFGMGLVQDEALKDPRVTASSSAPYTTLSTPELLKVKGAGWFKRLFKKIVHAFQAVARAISRVLQKVASAITKALTAVFGRTIGRALASIVNSSFSFALNSFYYIGQGDVKGLLKYWGQALLQMAIQAVLFFLPGVGQLLNFLGSFLGFIGGLLGQIGSFLGSVLPGLGQLVGGALQLAGKALTYTGQFLSRIGDKLMSQSKQLFRDLREQGLKGVFQSFKDRILEKINPITGYKDLWRSVTDGVNQLASRTGLSRFLGNVMEQVGIQVAQDKLDQKLEKSKMNAFVKAVLSTAASSGIQAIGQAVSNGITGFVSQIGQALGLRAPPINASSIERGVDYSKLLDPLGNNVEFTFNQDPSSPESRSIIFNDAGDPSQLLQGSQSFNLEKLDPNHFRADNDGGNFTELKFDPLFDKTPSIDQIGNLTFKTPEEYVKGLLGNELRLSLKHGLIRDAVETPAIFRSSYQRELVERVEKPFDLKNAGSYRDVLYLVAATDHGEALIDILNNSGRTIKIVETPGIKDAHYARGAIVIDPQYHPQLTVRRFDGSVTNIIPSDFRILGHELGHAATGMSDFDPPYPAGANVTYNENLIVMERGLDARFQYLSPLDISNPLYEQHILDGICRNDDIVCLRRRWR